MRLPFKYWALCVAVTLAAASGIGYAAILDTQPVIHGCYQKNGGVLRVIHPSSQHCRSSEFVLEWNESGPRGPQGPPGVTHADVFGFDRGGANLPNWIPIVSGTWPDIQPFMTRLLTMHLDKGNYAINAEVIAANYNGQGIIVCLMGNQTIGWWALSQSAVGTAPGYAVQQTFSAQGFFSLDAPADVPLSCFNALAGPVGNPIVGFVKAIATRIDTFTRTE